MIAPTRRGARPTLFLALALGGVSLTACGNAVTTEIVGTVGITVDAEDHPLVLVRVCEGRIDTIEVHGDRAGLAEDEANPILGSWHAETGRDGLVELALGAANDGWSGPDDLSLADGRTYVVTADDSGEDAEATQVSFTTAQLAALTPDQVIVGEGSTRPRSEFGACDR
ncbi:hypothetical protein RB608_24355 [Nocardioides sp. LHD-245]|uniref:hypothetical protein n=1 Tax=Nocardioides sp. LHD-245 TaxID=3051387 RepID=UPI0027E155DC|nr:hypothetical protein [Nocardioides sp. LHD-245]